MKKIKVFGREELENIYASFNKRELVSPDPLQFLYNYPCPRDREIVAVIAAVLAYGRVAQILRSVSRVLSLMGNSPRSFIIDSSRREIRKTFRGFKHRFTGEYDLACLLSGIKSIVQNHGSLEECFVSSMDAADGDMLRAIDGFAGKINGDFQAGTSYLFPSPSKGSACKRPMLFFRWLVRSDDVDPGGWTRVPKSLLIVPVDTHMHHFALNAGFTTKKNAALPAALEITENFRRICPEDPVKYDFAITRFGIRTDMDFTHIGIKAKKSLPQNQKN